MDEQGCWMPFHKPYCLPLQNRLLRNCTRSPLYRLQCEEDENLPLCRTLCTPNGDVNSRVSQQCEDAYSEFEVFCSEDFSVNGTCEDLPLFNLSCEERRRTCRLVCTGSMRDLDRQCGQRARDFCVSGSNSFMFSMGSSCILVRLQGLLHMSM